MGQWLNLFTKDVSELFLVPIILKLFIDGLNEDISN